MHVYISVHISMCADLCVCACVRLSQGYVKEYYLHHLWLGGSKVYIGAAKVYFVCVLLPRCM